MQRGIRYSAILHAILLLLVIFGLPSLFEMTREVEPVAISVEILPVSELSNVPNRVKTPKPDKEPPKPEEVKDPAPEPTPEKPEPEKPSPPTKTEEAKPEPVPVPDVKKDPKKEKPEKKDKKDDKKPKKEEEDLDAILKSVQQNAHKTEQLTPQNNTGSETTSKSHKFDPSQPLSMSEKDAIRSQFVKCWIVPAGARDAHSLIVTLNVRLQQDGTVSQVDVASGDKSRYASDSFFRAAADSAARAVWKCSPLKNLDPAKYSSWGEMELSFDPREMLY